MKRTILGLLAAVMFHLAVILFGGLLFHKPAGSEKKARVQEVDLLAPEDPAKAKDAKTKKEENPPADEPKPEAPLERDDAVPDLKELAKLENAGPAVPALDALSLSAMEDLMNPSAGGAAGFLSEGGDLASGGQIGGVGKAVKENGPDLFALAELDQKPRPLVQAPPSYPVELRRRKVEGSVYVLFVVDEQGRVLDPKVEKSSNPEFDPPALAAVRQWKFEPAVKGGQKVRCKMRVPLRFSVG
jgi:periplasmic protein TonB